MAVLRRDVDTQATLLNLMLRDLLNASQGEFKDLWLAFCFTFYCFTHFALANGTHAQKHYSHLCDYCDPCFYTIFMREYLKPFLQNLIYNGTSFFFSSSLSFTF